MEAEGDVDIHMKVLGECGLVHSRKEWKNTYYIP